jgi:hypothetical protein
VANIPDEFVMKPGAFHEFDESFVFSTAPVRIVEEFIEYDDRSFGDKITQLGQDAFCRTVQITVDMHESNLLAFAGGNEWGERTIEIA